MEINKNQSSYTMMQWTLFTYSSDFVFSGSVPRSRIMWPKSVCVLWFLIHRPALLQKAVHVLTPDTVSPCFCHNRHFDPLTFVNVRCQKMVFCIHLHFLFSDELKHFFPMCLSHLYFVYDSLPICFLVFIFFPEYFSFVYFFLRKYT